MRIALIGSAPSSVNIGPYQDASYNQFLGGKPPPQYPPSEFIDEKWDIWACSPGAWAVVPRIDRFFELHRPEPGKTWFSPEYWQFLCEFRGILYSGGPVEAWPNHVVYPIAKVEAEFGSEFLNSSLSLMMAVAIMTIEALRVERARIDALAATPQPEVIGGASMSTPTIDRTEDVIGLWGVDMSAAEEYGDQRPGCHFFVKEALRRGIAMYVPRESDLLRPMPVYGISEWDHNYIKATARMRELNSRREAATAAANQGAQQAQFLGGAIDNMNYMIKTWFSPYGIPSGVRVRLDPANPGMGGGITLQTPQAAEKPQYDLEQCHEVDPNPPRHDFDPPVDSAPVPIFCGGIVDPVMVRKEFSRLRGEGKITVAKLAARIHRAPSTVRAWLKNGPPTLDALSDICLGMGFEPKLGSRPIVVTPKSEIKKKPRPYRGGLLYDADDDSLPAGMERAIEALRKIRTPKKKAKPARK